MGTQYQTLQEGVFNKLESHSAEQIIELNYAINTAILCTQNGQSSFTSVSPDLTEAVWRTQFQIIEQELNLNIVIDESFTGTVIREGQQFHKESVWFIFDQRIPLNERQKMARLSLAVIKQVFSEQSSFLNTYLVNIGEVFANYLFSSLQIDRKTLPDIGSEWFNLNKDTLTPPDVLNVLLNDNVLEFINNDLIDILTINHAEELLPSNFQKFFNKNPRHNSIRVFLNIVSFGRNNEQQIAQELTNIARLYSQNTSVEEIIENIKSIRSVLSKKFLNEVSENQLRTQFLEKLKNTRDTLLELVSEDFSKLLSMEDLHIDELKQELRNLQAVYGVAVPIAISNLNDLISINDVES